MTRSDLPGGPHIHYRGDELWMDGVRLADVVEQHGTPTFVYSKAAMAAALDDYRSGFAGRKLRIRYAMKANSSLGLLQFFAQAGCGFDIVSIGELRRVLAAGGMAKQVVFSGVGKSQLEMREALLAGIECFNVESEAELDLLNQVALSCNRVAPVSIRVNPNVDPKTHPYISTGLKGNKFGVPHEAAVYCYRRAAEMPGLRVVGIDCHIGSQITSAEPYLDAIDRVLDLVEEVEAGGAQLQHIDFGGGLGIRYENESPPPARDLWVRLLERVDKRGFGDRLFMLEPGRSIVGNAGICLTEVLYLKTGEQKNFCIVDAAMNDLPRPSLYQAFHGIAPLSIRTDAPTARYDVVGPVCESGDWIGRDRSLNLVPGDRLAVLSAGAYCMSMASNYNSRPRAAEVLVDGDRFQLIRRRESFEDMVRNEVLL